MGRWRPPVPKGSPYITPAGYEALQRELDQLWLRRRDVVKALAAAAAEGDRSENAEYIYRKKELGGIDRRIRYLQKRLPDLKVVTTKPSGDTIFFGAAVELEDDAGKQASYRIVGVDEAAADEHRISIDSPLARGLLKKRAGDEVSVDIAGSTRTYLVVSVTYPA